LGCKSKTFKADKIITHEFSYTNGIVPNGEEISPIYPAISADSMNKVIVLINYGK
jgi:hypothetical protein